jgi:hypothetical protein
MDRNFGGAANAGQVFVMYCKELIGIVGCNLAGMEIRTIGNGWKMMMVLTISISLLVLARRTSYSMLPQVCFVSKAHGNELVLEI